MEGSFLLSPAWFPLPGGSRTDSVFTKVSAQKERGGDGLTCTFTQKTHETSRVQRLTWVI